MRTLLSSLILGIATAASFTAPTGALERHFQQWPVPLPTVRYPMPTPFAYPQQSVFPFPIPQPFAIPPAYQGSMSPYPFPSMIPPALPPSQYSSSYPSMPVPPAEAFGPQLGPVPGYDLITYQGNLCRVAPYNLPLHVYCDDPGLDPVVRRAANIWNEAAHHFQPQDVLRVEDRYRPGVIEIVFDSAGMPNRAVGSTSMEKSPHGVQVTGISIRPMNASTSTITQVLAHEMGHALGMDHSQDPDDLMYKAVHKGSLASLSQRDYDQFKWLYSQTEALPIVAAR